MSFINMSSLNATDYTIGLCGIVLTLHLLSKKLRTKQLPLPPGPRPLPLLGNVLDVPKNGEHEAKFWSKHKALYGPISSLTVLGQPIIVINDYKIAVDLLEKRSAIYSDRAVLTFAGEMIGLDVQTPMLRYNETLKFHRKHMNNYIGTRAAMRQHESLEELEGRRFMLRLLDDPENFLQHIRSLPGAVILKLSHGYSIKHEGNDPLVDLAEHVLGTVISESIQAGKWLVDNIRFLKHVPAWTPGAEFKRLAIDWSKSTNDYYVKPFGFVKHQMASGKAVPSFASMLLEQGADKQVGEDVVMYCASTLYGAGADTSVVALQIFFLAMTLYPEVYKRLQEEVDHVVGHDRLPSFTDRPHLPYVSAVIKETLRWQTILPSVIPHVTTEDDVYKGYFIPKGAIIVPVVWQMAHDPENYHDAFAFKPERFLEVEGRMPELDSRNFVFGFGRRICPGKELAESTMFIAISMTAAVFNISKAKDESGQIIEPVAEFSPGLLGHPSPFKSSVTPRSEQAVALVRSVVEEYPFVEGDSEVLEKL